MSVSLIEDSPTDEADEHGHGQYDCKAKHRRENSMDRQGGGPETSEVLRFCFLIISRDLRDGWGERKIQVFVELSIYA